MNRWKTLLDREFKKLSERKWDYIYIGVDIHDVILESNYKGLAETFLPEAKETLQIMSKCNKVKLIIYSCSHYKDLVYYINFLSMNNIKIDYINENPEVYTGRDDNYGNYEKKPYFNILLEDKAGFIPEDWKTIKEYFKNL